jgi:ABC-type spermidine/putrescine transport system permease subunit I
MNFSHLQFSPFSSSMSFRCFVLKHLQVSRLMQNIGQNSASGYVALLFDPTYRFLALFRLRLTPAPANNQKMLNKAWLLLLQHLGVSRLRLPGRVRCCRVAGLVELFSLSLAHFLAGWLARSRPGRASDTLTMIMVIPSSRWAGFTLSRPVPVKYRPHSSSGSAC